MKWTHALLLVVSGAVLLVLMVLRARGVIGWPIAAIGCMGVLIGVQAVLHWLDWRQL